MSSHFSDTPDMNDGKEAAPNTPMIEAENQTATKENNNMTLNLSQLEKPSDEAIKAAWSLIWQSQAHNDDKTLSDVSEVPDKYWPDTDTLLAGQAIREMHQRGEKVDIGRIWNEMYDSDTTLAQLMAILERDNIPYQIETFSPLRVMRSDYERRQRLSIVTKAKNVVSNPEEFNRIMSGLDLSEEQSSLSSLVMNIPENWRNIEIPPREFALGAACPLGCITIMCAAGGMGKSFLLLQAAMGLACNRELVPNWKPSAPGKVLFVCLEDDDMEIFRRMKRIACAFDFFEYHSSLIAQNLHPLPITNPHFFNVDNGEITASEELIQLAVMLKTGGYRLCIIDPVASMLGGNIDESANEQAQKVINILTSILPPDCALMLSAHTSKSERATAGTPRGAAAWTDGARQHWGMRASDEKNDDEKFTDVDPSTVVVLTPGSKSNYTAKYKPVCLAKLQGGNEAGVMKPLATRAKPTQLKQVIGQVNAEEKAFVNEDIPF